MAVSLTGGSTGASAATNPIIELYDRWHAAARLQDESKAALEMAEAALEKADEQADRLLDEIAATPAPTVAGAAARLRILLMKISGDAEPEHEEILRSVIEDLDRIEGPPPELSALAV